MAKLTAKQEKFCQLVAKGVHPTQAYRQAYDSKGSAEGVRNNAGKLIINTAIALRVATLRAPAIAHVEKTITVDLVRTLFENARIGFSDIRGVLNEDGSMKPPGEWDNDMAAAVSSIKVRELYGEGKDGVGAIGTVTEVKLWDKGAALDRLLRHMGGYEKDNQQKIGRAHV